MEEIKTHKVVPDDNEFETRCHILMLSTLLAKGTIANAKKFNDSFVIEDENVPDFTIEFLNLIKKHNIKAGQLNTLIDMLLFQG